jgi:hypothetical protein
MQSVRIYTVKQWVDREQVDLIKRVIYKVPLIKSGRIKLRISMIKIKAKIRSNSRAIPRIFNADIDYSGLKLISHDLFRGSIS